MQHLIRRDVVQYEADRLGGVHSGRHRNKFTLWQGDILRACTADRHRGNDLAWFDSSHLSDYAELKTEVAQGCAQIVFNCDRFRLQKLAVCH